MDWAQFKTYLSAIADLPKDTMHIYGALLVQFAGAFLLRCTLASFLPWALVLLLLVANETADFLIPGEPIKEWQVLGALRDLWNTMVLPTTLLLLTRFAPHLFCARRSDDKAVNPGLREH